jgi:hypothetical protein
VRKKTTHRLLSLLQCCTGARVSALQMLRARQCNPNAKLLIAFGCTQGQTVSTQPWCRCCHLLRTCDDTYEFVAHSSLQCNANIQANGRVRSLHRSQFVSLSVNTQKDQEKTKNPTADITSYRNLTAHFPSIDMSYIRPAVSYKI